MCKTEIVIKPVNFDFLGYTLTAEIITDAKLVLIIIIIIIIMIIIISIFLQDNVLVFSITASLPNGPPMNTDIEHYRTIFQMFF